MSNSTFIEVANFGSYLYDLEIKIWNSKRVDHLNSLIVTK